MDHALHFFPGWGSARRSKRWSGAALALLAAWWVVFPLTVGGWIKFGKRVVVIHNLTEGLLVVHVDDGRTVSRGMVVGQQPILIYDRASRGFPKKVIWVGRSQQRWTLPGGRWAGGWKTQYTLEWDGKKLRER